VEYTKTFTHSLIDVSFRRANEMTSDVAMCHQRLMPVLPALSYSGHISTYSPKCQQYK